MKTEKQDQNVGSESTAIQAGGNVTITQNQGLSVAEVKDLCLQFLRDNFPALREEASRVAKSNVEAFAASLESRIVERSGDILLQKFADPDVQAAINDAVQANARKGEISNPSLLVELIAERVSISTSDFKDIVLSEAITVVPKLTGPQISYLSFVHYMINMNVRNLDHISKLEAYSGPIRELVSDGLSISDAQKRHIEYAGACSIVSIAGVDIYKGWMNGFYKYLGYTNLKKFKDDLSRFSPSSSFLLEAFDGDSKGGEVSLTSVGRAIALANLSRVLGRMNYSIWLN